MARFTWHDDSVMAEFDDGSSELFRVGDVVSRNVPNYRKEPTRWLGVITSVWTVGSQMMVAEFKRGDGVYGAWEMQTRALGDKELEEFGLELIVDPLHIAAEFAGLQAYMADQVYKQRKMLEQAESDLDFVSSIFAPIRFSASERHRANHIEPAQSAEAVIRDLIVQGMLPPDQALAEARREAEQMFPEMEVDR